MGSVLKLVESLTNKISSWLGALGGVLVILLMLLISFGAISRYGFGVAHGWITDVSGYAMLLIAFLGAAQVQKNHGHVSMDLFVNMLGDKAKKIMGIIVSIISFLLSLALCWYGVVEVLNNIRENAMLVGTINVPKYYVIVFLPIGFLLLTSYFLRDIVDYFKSLRTGTKTED